MTLIPKGYKQTEVGVIPEDWEFIPLSEVCSMKSGKNITRENIDNYSAYPCYGGNGLRGFAKSFTHDGCFVLIGRQGALCGNVNGVSGKFYASEHAIVVTPNVAIDIHWLGVSLKSMNLNQYSESSAQPGLSVSKVLDLPIPLPPTKAEQEAIATALSDTDALIESLEQLIAKKRQIKQGSMQEILTGKRRLPGFSGAWEAKTLGDLGQFLKGSGITRGDANSGSIPCVRYGEIYTTHNDYIRQFHSWISSDVAKNATQLERGDLLFAGSGETKEEIGKCVAFLANLEAYAGGDIVMLRPRGVDSLFLGYALNTAEVNRQKASLGQGDAVVHISATALAHVNLLLPPTRDEQTAIAEVLLDMDAGIDALDAKLSKARLIKQGMMQELLTGRIRLV